MTPRAIRRAAERKAAKLAAKAARQNTATSTPTTAEAQQQQQSQAEPLPNGLNTAFDVTNATDEENLTAEKSFSATASGETTESPSAATTASAAPQAKPPLSEARLAANRKNAEHSTGARTTAGKLKVSLNALKTGLTSQIVVMPHEDAAAYQAYLERRFKKFAPAGDDEQLLVQAIVDNEFRLARIPALEAAIYAIGLREFAGEFADEQNLEIRASLIRAKTALHYRRDFSNQALQERRLRNHIEKDTAKLEELQKARYTRRKSQIEFCLKLKASEGPDFKTSDVGFDFSLTEFNAFLAHTATRFRLTGQRPDFDLFLAGFRTGKKEAQAA